MDALITGTFTSQDPIEEQRQARALALISVAFASRPGLARAIIEDMRMHESVGTDLVVPNRYYMASPEVVLYKEEDDPVAESSAKALADSLSELGKL